MQGTRSMNTEGTEGNEKKVTAGRPI